MSVPVRLTFQPWKAVSRSIELFSSFQSRKLAGVTLTCCWFCWGTVSHTSTARSRSERKRMEEHRIDATKVNGVGSDPESQRNHRHGRETGALHQRPQSVPQILQHVSAFPPESARLGPNPTSFRLHSPCQSSLLITYVKTVG